MKKAGLIILLAGYILSLTAYELENGNSITALNLADGLPFELSKSAKRIVSLNMCADELLMRLADPSRIASITWLSADLDRLKEFRFKQNIKINYGTAEEALALHPDLIVSTPFAASTAVNMLKSLRVPIVQLDVPNNFSEIFRQIEFFSSALNEKERGDELVEELKDGLDDQLGNKETFPILRAVVVNPNGLTLGPGTLIDDMIGRAGLFNGARALHASPYAYLSLEEILKANPDIVIVSQGGDGFPSIATEILNHPVMRRVEKTARTVSVSERAWNCSGPAAVEEVRKLRAAARELRESRATR